MDRRRDMMGMKMQLEWGNLDQSCYRGATGACRAIREYLGLSNYESLLGLGPFCSDWFSLELRQLISLIT